MYVLAQVVSPNIYNFDLWKTSGHAEHYRDNMFSFDVEKAEYGLKPMNCPGHCLMFASRARSYRCSLPHRALTIADPVPSLCVHQVYRPYKDAAACCLTGWCMFASPVEKRCTCYVL